MAQVFQPGLAGRPIWRKSSSHALRDGRTCCLRLEPDIENKKMNEANSIFGRKLKHKSTRLGEKPPRWFKSSSAGMSAGATWTW